LEWTKALSLLLVSLIATPCLPKPKPKRVYDQSGQVIPSPVHHDFSASYETADGHYYAYTCDETFGNIDCRDVQASCHRYVQLKDGRVLGVSCSPLYRVGDQILVRFTKWDFV